MIEKRRYFEAKSPSTPTTPGFTRAEALASRRTGGLSMHEICERLPAAASRRTGGLSTLLWRDTDAVLRIPPHRRLIKLLGATPYQFGAHPAAQAAY